MLYPAGHFRIKIPIVLSTIEIEQSFGLCGGGGMIWENGIKTCIISYKKQITNPGLMQDIGSLGLVQWDDPEGWYREGAGSG